MKASEEGKCGERPDKGGKSDGKNDGWRGLGKEREEDRT